MSLQNVVCGMVMILMISLLPGKECAFNVTKRAAAKTLVDTYEFPWFCIVALLDDMLSLCTIIHLKYVILSVDSLNRPRPETTQQYYEAPWDLTVYAGTESQKKLHFIFFSSHFYQSRSGEHLYVGNVTLPSTKIIENAVKDPKNLKDFAFDAYGIALNTGLLEIKGTFYWSPLVLPAPLFDWALNEPQMTQQINVFRINIESRPMDQTSCVLATWQPITKSLLLTEAIYIPEKQCEEAYCAFDEKACS
uniref:Uncharacterized protein n=1 Tax=Lygus hesperus TaxID=30085 RepID=A0A0A9Z1Q4_LYGHE